MTFGKMEKGPERAVRAGAVSRLKALKEAGTTKGHTQV